MNNMSLMGDYERFRSAISTQLGLQFEDGKLDFLGEVLRRRQKELGQSGEVYLAALERGPSATEVGALAQELTVPETYFFRNNAQFVAFAEVALPHRMNIQATSKVLRILSAGCASGEEAYTIAIIVRETIKDPSWTISVRAVDINPNVLEKAKRARYAAWSLRETPPEVLEKWFHPNGRDLILDDTLRGAVTFQQANLAVDDPGVWASETYDVIFCRNVLMYFAPDQARAVMGRIAQSLMPEGYLFLGHAETMRGLSDAFHLRHTHGTFYYQRKSRTEDTSVPLGEFSASLPPPPPPLSSSIPTFSDAWFDVIGKASQRVGALIPLSNSSVPAPQTSSPQLWDMTQALELLGMDRFPEALAYIRGMPSNAENDPDMQLLEAIVLVHSGALVEAEAVCQRFLLSNELNAGAHYVLALCRESLGDPESAADHDRVAIYLDPAFAMPRLHLALLARRAGDRVTAKRELGSALVLLKSEDTSRILLFGGGFNREVLTTLCESALRDCGGVP